MDITELSMNLSQSSLLNAVGTTMLGKSIDLMEGQAEAFAQSIDMNAPSLESLVYPTSGTSIDLRI
ncbi:Putative motility protein [Pseudobutyrivibrio sp. ACV-2]|uniref:YjfB family protein n=1 Tax=Pseudobutyrivibrio sp. ACV-2 TaxID=1520801 RepID=UPI000898FED4|nr:YjfB family protein [Pseudobutyrivibrio sp. ACV-2]SEA57163.1 Putative motility protein [Pseudobutyrivibrio sp. ACV-2]